MQSSKSKRNTLLQSDLSLCFHFDLSQSLDEPTTHLPMDLKKPLENGYSGESDSNCNLKKVICLHSSRTALEHLKLDEPYMIGSINSRSTTDFESAEGPTTLLFGKVDFSSQLSTPFNKITVKTQEQIGRSVSRGGLHSFSLKKSNFIIASSHRVEPIGRTPRYLILKNLRMFRKGIKKYQKKKRATKTTIFSPMVFNQWSPKVTCCSCKSSKCVKMYCECFKTRGYCVQQCRCLNCINNKQQFPVSIRDISFSSNMHSPLTKTPDSS